jgi:hypothetical protein
MAPAGDQPLKTLGDGNHVDTAVQSGADHGAKCRVHAGGVASGGQDGQAAVDGLGQGHGSSPPNEEHILQKPDEIDFQSTNRGDDLDPTAESGQTRDHE